MQCRMIAAAAVPWREMTILNVAPVDYNCLRFLLINY